jgi:uncharacterized protein YbcC (UPF0753/DUF2309 family)
MYNNATRLLEHEINSLIQDAWKIIAPFWPLRNLVSINPLQGLEYLPIEQALIQANALFQYADFPDAMGVVNRQTIKWLQAFFDAGQATLNMPMRHLGLYTAWKKLAWFDQQIHSGEQTKQLWLRNLPESPQDAIIQVLSELCIAKDQMPLFLTLMLTTLPGWAGHIQYRVHDDATQKSLKTDYMAIRLIMTRLMWDTAMPDLMQWHARCLQLAQTKPSPLAEMQKNESSYMANLLQALSLNKVGTEADGGVVGTEAEANGGNDARVGEPSPIQAQLVFCIDVRSEPFRRILEPMGPYETFGFSGFFGLPIGICDTTTGQNFASCPVLLQPKYYVEEGPVSTALRLRDAAGYERLSIFKNAYQSLKYNIGTAFALVECLGVFSGIWMAIKTLFPVKSVQIREELAGLVRPPVDMMPTIEHISLADQCQYAEFALRNIGLISNFAPVLVLCGHGSTTENNAYASLLHCGACGGQHGSHNAKVLALILNNPKVRTHLATVGIIIPETTRCIAAEHNTTTDVVELYESCLGHGSNLPPQLIPIIETLREHLIHVRMANTQKRCKTMGFYGDQTACSKHAKKRSNDWSQIRPEWGLAGNASFIIGPRSLSKGIDLQGRVFLHSYDHQQDTDGRILTGILTAPMVVAQWINNQYLFSTSDPVAYGSGSKITKNITGKIGVMQGAASDLMTGLPMQSVYRTDTDPYHQPLRLNVVVHGPRALLDSILSDQPVLQKLFGHGWILLTCIDPHHRVHFLNRDFTWRNSLM